MKRNSIFAQIERYERMRRRDEERHRLHIEKGKPRLTTCFLCRLEAAKRKREAALARS
jgi:hypothetical protein